jgi:hypothetical protein
LREENQTRKERLNAYFDGFWFLLCLVWTYFLKHDGFTSSKKCRGQTKKNLKPMQDYRKKAKENLVNLLHGNPFWLGAFPRSRPIYFAPREKILGEG